MQRLSQLEHHVVCHVDDVVDGPHPCAEQPLLHPHGRRSHLHALDQRGGVAQAQVRRLDLDAGEMGIALNRHRLALQDRHDIPAQRLARHGGNLPRRAVDALQVTERALHVIVEHDIAHVVEQRHPDRCVIGQHQVPLVAVAQVQFFLRADHPLGDDAADLAGLKPDDPALFAVTVDQPRAGHGVSDLGALAAGEILADIGHHVGCAGYDGHRLVCAVVDTDQGQPLRVRVAHHLQDLAHENLVAVPELTDGGD